MKVEYLIIIDSGNPFCRDKKSFDNFLQSNADISIQGSVFKHKSLEVEYELQGGETEADKNRFFHIKLNCKDESRIDELHELLKETRKLLHVASDKNPQVLWDDVSSHYSEKAYPAIHEIENLMRKLITKFMLTKVGLGWTKEAVPEKLKKATRTEPANNNNYLYEADFKDLSTFLFDDYRTLDIKALNERIQSLENEGGEVSFSAFKGFLPKSNWERYFREHVDCESLYLEVRWEKLYKLRCKIAHNTSFTKEDYSQMLLLVSDVKPKIEDAIINLDKVEVPEEERDELAEVAASKSGIFYYEYIQKWKKVNKRLSEDINALSSGDLGKSRTAQFNNSLKFGIFDERLLRDLGKVNDVRSILAHESGRFFSNGELLNRTRHLDKLIDSLWS